MDGSTTTVTDYLDGFQYDNQVLQFFPHAEGYVKATVMTMGPGNPVYGFNYVYNYTDHLGNIRLSYAKDPQSGDLKVMEENNYYPFGLKHNYGSSSISLDFQKQLDDWGVILAPVTNNPYQYKYNGKELQDELGLNMYAMDARMYDPAIARWVVLDPVIHHSMSPYNAFDNNPVFWADPSGADAEQSSGDGDSGLGTYGIPMATVLSTSAGGAAYAQSNGKGDPPTGGKDKKNGDPTNKKDGALTKNPNQKPIREKNTGSALSKYKTNNKPGATKTTMTAKNTSQKRSSAVTVTHTERIETNAIIDNIALKVYNAVDKTSGDAGVINADITTNVSDNSVTVDMQLNSGITQTSYSMGSDGFGMGGNVSAFDTGLGTDLNNSGFTLTAFNSGGEGVTNSFNVQVKPVGMAAGLVISVGVIFVPEITIPALLAAP